MNSKNSRYYAVVLLVALVLFAVNMYLKGTQKLYLVNQYTREAEVAIAEKGEFKIPALSVKEISIGEGKYQVSVKVTMAKWFQMSSL